MITEATLKRYRENEYGTFGKLYVVDEVICYTLEPLWKDNKENVSCIPKGKYIVTPWMSPHHGNCFKIWGVPHREDILIHKGNWLKDTKGCILAGLDAKKDMVIESSLAMGLLFDMFTDGFVLRIAYR